MSIDTVHVSDEKSLLELLASNKVKDKIVLISFNTPLVPASRDVVAEVHRIAVKHRPQVFPITVDSEGKLNLFKKFNIGNLPIVFVYRNGKPLCDPITDSFSVAEVEKRLLRFLNIGL